MYLVASISQRLKEDQSSRKILYFPGMFAQSPIKMLNISASNIKGLTPESHFPAQNKIREDRQRREMGEPQEEKDSKLDWHRAACLKQTW